MGFRGPCSFQGHFGHPVHLVSRYSIERNDRAARESELLNSLLLPDCVNHATVLWIFNNLPTIELDIITFHTRARRRQLLLTRGPTMPLLEEALQTKPEKPQNKGITPYSILTQQSA